MEKHRIESNWRMSVADKVYKNMLYWMCVLHPYLMFVKNDNELLCLLRSNEKFFVAYYVIICLCYIHKD